MLNYSKDFNFTFVTEIILKLPELNHSSEIYSKCFLTDKLFNYNLSLVRNILHKLGIIFNFENKTITWQEVSISMKTPNCTAKKFFVIKESRPVRIVTKKNSTNFRCRIQEIQLKINYHKSKSFTRQT